jgi:hypothetical protein
MPPQVSKYNTAMMVHPSCWGYTLTPLVETADTSKISPVYFGYYLKLGDEALLDKDGPMLVDDGSLFDQWQPRPGAPVEEGGMCPVCFTGDIPGCPACWDFAPALPFIVKIIAQEQGVAPRASADGHLPGGKSSSYIDLDAPDLDENALARRLSDEQKRQVGCAWRM